MSLLLPVLATCLTFTLFQHRRSPLEPPTLAFKALYWIRESFWDLKRMADQTLRPQTLIVLLVGLIMVERMASS